MMDSNLESQFINIEATQTFSPGNVELLIYLLKKLEERKVYSIVYLRHSKTLSEVKELNLKYAKIIRTSTMSSFIRFIKGGSNTLFFCSYPPFREFKNSLVYFHSTLFTNPKIFLKDNSISFKQKIKRYFVFLINYLFNKNVDAYYCQTNLVLDDLKINFNGIKVDVYPFYDDLELNAFQRIYGQEIVYDFFYPATADTHKNYFNLFDAILILGKKKKVSLVVTVAKNKLNFIERINEVNSELGYEAIINIGRVSKQVVIDYYKKVKAMVFPSLEESLGLPLIEAASLKLTIIGSDLPYLYDVVENPIVFDPYNPEDIAFKMNNFLEGKYGDVEQSNKVKNQIEHIINFFKK